MIDKNPRIIYERSKCEQHCYHTKRGPIMMVIPDGHIVEECCKCHQTRTVHADHAIRQRQRADASSYFAPMGRYWRSDGNY